MQFTNNRLLVLLLCLALFGTQSIADTQPLETPVSVVEVPIRLSLEPLIDAAEKALPTQAGNWRNWKNWHGVRSRYRAWRGPLGITIRGDVLTVQAHIRYWIKARKKLLGSLNLKGSCGVNEAPRQALIGMQVRLGWGPDWTLRPEFHVLPTRFLDRCEMTIANIDVTPLVEKEFRKQMQNSLRAALLKLAPGMHAIRQQAQHSWSLLQESIELGQGNHLMLRPTAIALSHINGRGKYIDAQLAIRLQPGLVTGSEASVEPQPLPPLGRLYPRPAGLNLQLGVDLDFASLAQRISDTLDGKPFVIQGRKLGIERFHLAGSGQIISARMGLSGGITGTVEFQARLAYDAQDRKLVLRNLTFDYTSGDVATTLLAKTLHDPISMVLEDAANQVLAQHLDLLNNRLETVLQKITPTGVTLDISALQLQELKIQVAQQGIRLEGTATGNVRIALR